jgi:hypothetical protein
VGSQSFASAISQGDVSDMYDLLEESHELERHSGSKMNREGRDPKMIEGVHVS